MKSQAPGRSPAEKAFDFLLLPSVLYVVLLAASLFTTTTDSDEDVISAPTAVVRAIQAGGVLSLIHWLIGVRKVWRSRHDPVSKVLHFSSAVILAMQAIAIAAIFGMRPIARLVFIFPD